MTWKVWYRPEGATSDFSKGQDHGTLTIEADGAVFESKKQRIVMDRIRSVGKKRIGMWLVWADIEYEAEGAATHAYFGDRRMLGWGGILGGNTKIGEAAEAARAKQSG